MVTRKNGNKSVEDQVIDQTVVETIDPMIDLLVNKIRLLDPQLAIADNLTVDDLLELVAIATTNKKVKEQLIALIESETNNDSVIKLLPKMSIQELQETLDKIETVKLISKARAVKKDKVNFIDYQPSKSVDCMLVIQGQKTQDQLIDDPIPSAIGSVLLKIGSVGEIHFAECFETTVVLTNDTFTMGLDDKQIKSLHKEVCEYWCLSEKTKKVESKKVKTEEKNKARKDMRQKMIDAIRDRK